MAKNKTTKLSLPVGDGDHTLGPENARVTLVEYGDLECIHCRQVHPIIKRLRRRLGNRLHYVFRHFPIRSIHPHAQMAAEATEAAGAQGKYWEMHEYILERQDQLDNANLVQYAAELGLDLERFQRELDERVYAEKVNQDFQSGVESGINGTPSFFINGQYYDGPWDFESLIEAIEKPLGAQVQIIFREFARIEASGGVVLLICTILALLWANSAWAESYFHLWETNLGISIGGLSFEHSLYHWVNDGLMVIFFFVVGLEIKREVTTGELRDIKRAMLPIMAAIGGMVVPAAIYLLFNAGGPGEPGWGIPMATDIAFTLGILALLGSRAPFSLKVFFTALAIVDDLAAVLVIAIFYTSEIAWFSLLIAGIILIVLFALNRARIYSPLPYAILGIALWLAFIESGVHPTIAGVLLAITIPTRSPPEIGALLAQCVSVLNEFDTSVSGAAQTGNRHQVAAKTLESVADRMQSPAQRLEHGLHPWTTYVILPIFALANAGVSFSGGENLFSPVSIGVILGLVIGKPLGVTLFSWIAVKSGLARLPAFISWRQLFSASWLAGIGFTMSLFIAGAAFIDINLLNNAKIGILVASLVAAVAGYGLSMINNPTYEEHTQMEAAPATD
jgi:NhaA family Na+:H+ antiporter